MPRNKLFWAVLSKDERRLIVEYETKPLDSPGWNMPEDVRCCGLCGEPVGSYSCGCGEAYDKVIKKAKRLMNRVKVRAVQNVPKK
jgi:hypothetical protein